MPALEDLPLARYHSLVFQQDNASSHASNHKTEFESDHGFTNGHKMDWPACSPDLNPIENLWSTVKRNIYAGG